MERAAAATVRPRPADPAPARGLRGLLVGLVSGGGAYAAHLVAGGHPAVVVSLVVVGLAVGAGVGLARWRIGLRAALVLTLSTQGASHLLLAGTGAHDHLGHLSHLDHATGAGAGHGGLLMVAAHAGVAVATALVARGADQVVLDLLRALVGWFVPRTWLPRAPLTRTRFAHLTDARLLPSYAAARGPLTRRGPPVPARIPVSLSLP